MSAWLPAFARAGLRAGLLGGLLCLVSACWVSQQPLLGDANAARIGFAGSYIDAGQAGQSVLTIAETGDGRYEMYDEDERFPARFLALGDDWYVVEYEVRDDEPGSEKAFYLFQPIRVNGGDLHFYTPECGEDAAPIEGLIREEETCAISSLAALDAVARIFVQHVESGAFSGPANIYVPLGSP